MNEPLHSESATLRARRMGIDAYQEPVIYMREDCHVCRSEGFEAQSRVLVRNGVRAIVATQHVVTEALIGNDEAGFSEAAWRRLGARDGDSVSLSHPDPPESLSHVRANVYGHELNEAALQDVVTDVAAGRYSDIQLACFVTAFAGDRLSDEEVAGLTRAMVSAGDVQRIASVPSKKAAAGSAHGSTSKGAGVELARSTLDSGRAWTRFQTICEAQGGMRKPPEAPLREEIPAPRSGRVVEVDTRRLARIAQPRRCAARSDSRCCHPRAAGRSIDTISWRSPRRSFSSRRCTSMDALTGATIGWMPLEDLLFAMGFGMYWSGVYEHFTWSRCVDKQGG